MPESIGGKIGCRKSYITGAERVCHAELLQYLKILIAGSHTKITGSGLLVQASQH